MKQRTFGWCAAIALLSACASGNSTGSLPAASGAGNAMAGTSGTIAAANATTVISAVDKANGNKPLAGLLITLSRNSDQGPVVDRTRTGPGGKVKFFRIPAASLLCGWGVFKTGGRESRASFCGRPFPAQVRLEFH